jgi:hypothetical protein
MPIHLDFQKTQKKKFAEFLVDRGAVIKYQLSAPQPQNVELGESWLNFAYKEKQPRSPGGAAPQFCYMVN